MEAQNIIAFEYKKEDRIYRLQMPSGAPLGEAYESVCSFLSEIGRMINEHVKSQMPIDPKDEEDKDLPKKEE